MTLLQTDFLPNKSETFQAFRYLLQMTAIQPGVMAANDFKAVQRAAGANMSVDIGAGDAWVQGASNARQGLYHQTNDATLNAVVTAANGTNPRLDQVFLVVNDSAVVGASDTPALVVIAGTPSAGATLDNRTGAVSDATIAATYPNRIRLADILVPAASTSVVTANIRDRRPWARGARFTDGLGVGNTTSSPSPGVAISGASLWRMECSGAPATARINGVLRNNTSGLDIGFALMLDGVMTRSIQGTSPAANPNFPIGFEHWLLPTIGSHTLEWRFFITGGGIATTMAPSYVVFEENLVQNVNNG